MASCRRQHALTFRSAIGRSERRAIILIKRIALHFILTWYSTNRFSYYERTSRFILDTKLL